MQRSANSLLLLPEDFFYMFCVCDSLSTWSVSHKHNKNLLYGKSTHTSSLSFLNPDVQFYNFILHHKFSISLYKIFQPSLCSTEPFTDSERPDFIYSDDAH